MQNRTGPLPSVQPKKAVGEPEVNGGTPGKLASLFNEVQNVARKQKENLFAELDSRTLTGE